MRLVRTGDGESAAPGPLRLDQPVATGRLGAAAADWATLPAQADAGQAAWRADPLAVAREEGLGYGLRADAQWGEPEGEDDGLYGEALPTGGGYRVRLVQPARRGPGGIRTVAAIEPHGDVARHSTRLDVTTPRIGPRAASPLPIAGTARTDSFWIEPEDGHHVLARQTAQAPGGPFDLRVPLPAPTSPHGTLTFATGRPTAPDRAENPTIPVSFARPAAAPPATR